MKKIRLFLALSFFTIYTGCFAYLGFHGPSIQAKPDVHENVSEDQECLECHHPDNAKEADAPPTGHWKFKGCLKCHNDNLNESR